MNVFPEALAGQPAAIVPSVLLGLWAGALLWVEFMVVTDFLRVRALRGTGLRFARLTRAAWAGKASSVGGEASVSLDWVVEERGASVSIKNQFTQRRSLPEPGVYPCLAEPSHELILPFLDGVSA
jgi:hypothetical protein